MVGTRYLIAVGVEDPGAGSRLQRLAGVRDDLSRMYRLFVDRLGYEPVMLTPIRTSTPHANLNVSAETLRAGLLRWRKQTHGQVPRSVVFYFSGHGLARGDDLHLCTHGFDDAVAASGLDVRGIVQSLDRASPQLWIILDVCYAGAGAKALAHEAAQAMGDASTALWFLASSGGRVPSHDGFFTRAFVQAARLRPRSHEAFAANLTAELTRSGARQRVQQISAGQAAFDLLQSESDTRGTLSRLHVIAPASSPRLALLALITASLFLCAVIVLRIRSADGAAPLTTTVAASNTSSMSPPQQPASIQSTAVPAPVSSPPRIAERVRSTRPDQPAKNGGMRVSVLAEPIGRTVLVTAAEPLRGGDLFGLYVTLAASAYVGVIHVALDGRLTLLYPQSRELRVQAGDLTRVPRSGEGNLVVDREPGVDHFLVVALREPIRAQTPAHVVELLSRTVDSPRKWLQPRAHTADAAAPVQVVARYWRDDETQALIGAALIELRHAL